MVEPPLLAKHNSDGMLYLYLAVSDKAISAVQVKEEARIQNHVYYVSKVLYGANLTTFP